jgi:diacylglycerol O-acyltransferase / wax synthase
MRHDGGVASPPDRLSALDASFLDLDTAVAPLHVGWTMRFEGTTPPVAQLRRHLEKRLDHVPRFRRRVAAPRMGLGDLRWSDDPGFDIANHVHALRLAEPGGPAELRELAGTLLSVPLDPARPLWRLYLVDGLRSGGFAVIGQAHHALVDGIAAIEVALLLFTPDPPARARPDGSDPVGPWLPARPGSVASGAKDAVRARVGGGGRTARALVTAARRTDATRLREVAGALESFARPSAATSLDRTVGPAREVAFATTDLEGVRDAGRRHGGTINDVLLAACALALGRALRRRGEHPETVKVLVPVNVRDGTPDGAAPGNKISFVGVDLPIAETDPVRVLRRVRAQTRAAKAAGEAGPLAAIADAADALPAGARRVVTRAAARAASFTAIVSNVPGPPVDLELLGRPLAALFPAVPCLDGHALTIGALSYRGRLHVGVTADAVVVPDAVDLARDLEQAFDTLRVLPAAREVTPWRERARTRRSGLRALPAPAADAATSRSDATPSR